jgi:hypothetical protein
MIQYCLDLLSTTPPTKMVIQKDSRFVQCCGLTLRTGLNIVEVHSFQFPRLLLRASTLDLIAILFARSASYFEFQFQKDVDLSLVNEGF